MLHERYTMKLARIHSAEHYQRIDSNAKKLVEEQRKYKTAKIWNVLMFDARKIE